MQKGLCPQRPTLIADDKKKQDKQIFFFIIF